MRGSRKHIQSCRVKAQTASVMSIEQALIEISFFSTYTKPQIGQKNLSCCQNLIKFHMKTSTFMLAK